MSRLSEQQRSAKTNKYTMRKRAEQVEQTRLEITEAAVRLHTTIGPAKTTISAVAEEAQVTRVTVYRHFPDEESLFSACMMHWQQLHPGPDPSGWMSIDDLEERASHAFGELYGYFRHNHRDLQPIYRDFESMPDSARKLMQEQQNALSASLLHGSKTQGERALRLSAVAGLLTSFSTWWLLAIEGGLDDSQITELAVRFLTSV